MGERAAELVGLVDLGDARLNRRLEQVVEELIEHPQATIPEACGNWASTLAAYRLLENEAVLPETIVAGIGQATASRWPGSGVLLAVQDTTTVDYTGHRVTEGVGPLESPAHRGLIVHTTLAVSPEGSLIGLLDQQLWARDPSEVGSRHQRATIPIEGKESVKWLRSLRAGLERASGQCEVVTVADREADIYEVFALAAELAGDWLIRARHDRQQLADGTSMERTVMESTVVATKTVEVARKPDQPMRTATVEVRTARVQVKPPAASGKAAKAQWYADHPGIERVGPTVTDTLTLGVVLVTEPQPPSGETAVRWLLVTSLPVTTAEDALTCVDYYRLRWLVERFHFVLKSGCRVEQLQLEHGERLRRALAIYSAVAAWLLHATLEARVSPDAPATTILDEEALHVLLSVRKPGQPLPAEPPTVREAIRLVASLGGFLARKGDGEPGVVTVWRGFRRLSDMIVAWRAFTHLSTASPPER